MRKTILLFMSMFFVLGTAMAQDKGDNTEPATFGLKTVTPGDGASVTKVERIQFEFTKDVAVTMPEAGIEVKNTQTNEVYKLTRLYENEYMPKSYVILEFEQIMAEGKDGKEELTNQVITTPGAYTYTIPAGMIKSADGKAFAERTFTFSIVGTFPIDGCSPLEANKYEKVDLTFSKEIAQVANLSKLYVMDTYYYSPVAYVNGYTISEDKKTVTLTFDNAITEEGWYDFPIPEGTFISADGEINAYADFWLNVVDLTPAFMTNWENGSKVQELGNLEITFKNVNEVKLVENGPKVAAYLPSGSDIEGTATLAEGKITVSFGQLTEEGEYVFVIPAGMFTMDGVPNEVRELTVTLFTFEITPLKVVSVTPEVGEVDSISKIVVKYNQIVSPSYNENWQMISQQIMLTCGEQQYILSYAPESWSATDEMVYLVNAEWNGYEYVSTPVVAAGTYTLNLADIVVDHAGEEYIDEWGYPNTVWHSKGKSCEGTCTWTIKEGSAIKAINATESEQTIYDLLGRRVQKITGAGIYIVNGKKVVIK